MHGFVEEKLGSKTSPPVWLVIDLYANACFQRKRKGIPSNLALSIGNYSRRGIYQVGLVFSRGVWPHQNCTCNLDVIVSLLRLCHFDLESQTAYKRSAMCTQMHGIPYSFFFTIWTHKIKWYFPCRRFVWLCRILRTWSRRAWFRVNILKYPNMVV